MIRGKVAAPIRRQGVNRKSAAIDKLQGVDHESEIPEQF